jgi:hypothetical protein
MSRGAVFKPGNRDLVLFQIDVLSTIILSVHEKLYAVQKVLTAHLSRRILQLCQNQQNEKTGHESFSICTIVNLQSNSLLIPSEWLLFETYGRDLQGDAWMTTSSDL